MTLKEQLDFSVRVITWNVASTYPEEDLRRLLGLSDPLDGTQLPDMYALGYQEVSVRPMNVVNQALFEEPWIASVRFELSKHNYVKLISYRLQGILLMVFVRRGHLLRLRDVRATCVRTGLGGVWGNKGASLVSVRLPGGASLCLVNSHLAAHDHEYKKRLAEFETIVSSASFGGACGGSASLGLMEHDYTLWFGDLNFRLDEVSMDQLREAIRQDTVMDMFKFDQLTRAQRSGEAFELFSELPVTFKPTFKFQQGTANYKLNARKPAWTDRILYRGGSPDPKSARLAVSAEDYRSHEDYVQSDHKPVSATLRLRLHAVVVDASRNPEERIPDGVHFFNTRDWSVSRGFEVWFCTASDMALQSSDWIALLPENFSSLDEYVGYIWVDGQNTERQPADDELEGMPAPRRCYRQSFSDQMLVLPGRYVLVYFRSTCDVLGISDTFQILDCAGVD